MCVENMMLGRDVVDQDTGEITEEAIPVLPTDYIDQGTSIPVPVENPEVWVYPVSSETDDNWKLAGHENAGQQRD